MGGRHSEKADEIPEVKALIHSVTGKNAVVLMEGFQEEVKGPGTLDAVAMRAAVTAERVRFLGRLFRWTAAPIAIAAGIGFGGDWLIGHLFNTHHVLTGLGATLGSLSGLGGFRLARDSYRFQMRRLVDVFRDDSPETIANATMWKLLRERTGVKYEKPEIPGMMASAGHVCKLLFGKLLGLRR